MKIIYLSLVFGLILASCTSTSSSDEAHTKHDVSQVEKPADGLVAMVLLNGNYGYITTDGEFSIRPEYALARTFSNGIACVNKNGNRDEFIGGAVGGEYVFVDQDNNEVFGGKKFYLPGSFYDDFAMITMENNKTGFINNKGELVISGFDGYTELSEGLIGALDKKTETVGYIDTEGKWIIKLDYKYNVSPFKEGLAKITTGGKAGYIDKTGKIVIEVKYDNAYDFSDGLAVIEIDDKYGFINTKGELVIPAIYKNAGDFNKGICSVLEDEKWGFINKKGETVIEDQFDAVRDFKEGFAVVQIKDKIGFINTNGEWLIEPTFESGVDFKNGYAIIQQNKKLGFINIKGEIVIEPMYERVGYFVNPNESNKIIKIN